MFKYNAKVEPIPMPENLIGQYQKYTCSDNTKLLKTIGKFKFTKPEEWIETWKDQKVKQIKVGASN